MENLSESAPQKLIFDDPLKSPMSSQKIVSIKPTSGQSIDLSPIQLDDYHPARVYYPLFFLDPFQPEKKRATTTPYGSH